MTDFTRRSDELELMDLPITRQEDLFLNLRELEFINTLTGGPSLVFATFRKLLANRTDEVHIADIGFGAGDMFVYILQHKHLLPCPIRLTGVDLMPEAQNYALQMHPELANSVNFVTADYQVWFEAGNKPDIVLASLFCHHLTNAQLVIFFANIQQNTQIGGIINDLQRHPIAYYGIKVLTKVFSSSYYTKNDAPLSVLRGFRQNELQKLLQKSNITTYTLNWRWAFRYLLYIEAKK
jgi:2-polyprenyl-3-methyl-5-hydroxy-6-metoxy-1,4-benzoquinol methylase